MHNIVFAVCHYYTHVDCIPSAVADCKETATYHPGKLLQSVHHEHHWREGNLRPGAVCYACAKQCWTTDCLAGFRCEWCGITVSENKKKKTKTEKLKICTHILHLRLKSDDERNILICF